MCAEELRRRVREQAGHRCSYCVSPQHLVLGTLEIEHPLPRGCGGSNDEWNLWLACRLCNNCKSDQTSARDPETGQEVPLYFAAGISSSSRVLAVANRSSQSSSWATSVVDSTARTTPRGTSPNRLRS